MVVGAEQIPSPLAPVAAGAASVVASVMEGSAVLPPCFLEALLVKSRMKASVKGDLLGGSGDDIGITITGLANSRCLVDLALALRGLARGSNGGRLSFRVSIISYS